MPGLLSAAELSRSQLEELLKQAREFSLRPPRQSFADRVVGLVFMEESLRTRVGYGVAAGRLGATSIAVEAAKRNPAMGAAESLEDTLRSLEPNCDVICLRERDEDAPRRAAACIGVPVVNCGNGRDEHPSQALIDLMAIKDLRGEIDGSRIAIVGDLMGMRSSHSLALALARFEGITLRCISPSTARLPARYARPFEASGNTLETTDDLDLDDVHVVYVAGMPRTAENGVSRADQDRLRITPTIARRLPPDARILCPLPRVDEIESEVDTLEAAAYWRQNALGSFVRMAVLTQALDPASR